MLFNSFEFIFIFLPLALFLFYFFCLRKLNYQAILSLVLMSLLFYSYWNHIYVLLIVTSIFFNYLSGLFIVKTGNKIILVSSVTINLLILGYFKYCNFFISNINKIFQTDISTLNIFLPLAISFFTFTQIAYIVDIYKHKNIKYDLLSYSLFVLFFPHLIAGPIVYHKEIIPQFKDKKTFKVYYHNLATGILLFFLGLFKKVVIADYFSPYVHAVFDIAEKPTFIEAWAGALAYTMQIYFDFSGYTDMALGLALMFNIKMPHNFDSPYKSNSIIEFWRKWHMTLSRFLKDYLYIPLGGNRRGKTRKYINLMLTMLLGGLWHGAGWTYVVWGGLHGIYLCINHELRAMNIKLHWIITRIITFTGVVIAWIFFRANNLNSAINIISGCAGLNGFTIHPRYATKIEIIFIILALIAVNIMPNSIWFANSIKPRLKWLVFVVILAIISLTMIDNPTEFLYFQF